MSAAPIVSVAILLNSATMLTATGPNLSNILGLSYPTAGLAKGSYNLSALITDSNGCTQASSGNRTVTIK